MTQRLAVIALGGFVLGASQSRGMEVAPAAPAHYPVVGTGQDKCYSERGDAIDCPAEGTFLAGQDAQHRGKRPWYQDHGDGTVTEYRLQKTGVIVVVVIVDFFGPCLLVSGTPVVLNLWTP
jgi:hypothetical protein